MTASTVVTSVTSGFLYAASTMGVTGARSAGQFCGPRAGAPLRGHSPTCRSRSGSASRRGSRRLRWRRYADGVIVGSAFVKRILQAPDQAAAVAAVAELAGELAAGVRAG